jgi:hypothetical protein
MANDVDDDDDDDDDGEILIYQISSKNITNPFEFVIIHFTIRYKLQY